MTQCPTAFNVKPSLDAAKLIVGEDLSNKGLSDERLNLIATYLAAHFITIAVERGGLLSTKTGDAEDSFVRPFGEALSANRFGQQVLFLDTTGIMANKSKTAKNLKALFRVV